MDKNVDIYEELIYIQALTGSATESDILNKIGKYVKLKLENDFTNLTFTLLILLDNLIGILRSRLIRCLEMR